jgi:hypothetical protein
VPSVNNPAAYINLDAETAAIPFAVGAFSVNDGRKWRAGPLPDGAAFSKLLDKGMTLRVAQGFDTAAKRPTGDIVAFPVIERRPRANPEKLRVFNNAPNWELRDRDGRAGTLTYIWAPTTDKRNPSGVWTAWSGSLPLPAIGLRETVLLRTPASAVAATTTSPAVYTPAGRVFRVNLRG